MDRSHLLSTTHSPLSNTGAFAGVIVGVTVSCLIIIGFFIYKIKHPKLKLKPPTLTQNSARFSQLAASATTGPIKLPPQPDNTPEPDHPPDHTSSNPFSSLRRSSRTSANPAVLANSNGSSRSGAFFTPPGTPTDRNGLDLSQRSDQPSLSHPIPQMLSSGSSGTESYRGSGARASTGAVSAATSQAVSVPRPLPLTSHPPPPYSSNSASFQPSLTQDNSSAPSPLSSVVLSDEKRRSHRLSDGISRVRQSQPFHGEYPLRSTAPSTDDNPGAERLQSPFGDLNRAVLSSTLPGPLRDSVMSLSTEMEHGNGPPSSWRSALSPFLHRPSSAVSDPFNHKGFELPNWLESDPYSQSEQGARATASQCSGAQRSVAASSKILPSDTSLRTLTPEPSEDTHDATHDATLHVAVLAKFRTTSLGHGSLGHGTDVEGAMPGESVEGDGPESYAVQISNGAQRKGWGAEDKKQSPRREMPLASSSNRPRLLHLQRPSELVHSGSSGPSSPSTGLPLSAEFEVRGLGRSFIQSLMNKVLYSPTTPMDNPRLLTSSREPPRSPEDQPAWLRGDQFDLPRVSMGAASSMLLPSELGDGDASSRLQPGEVGYGDTSSIRSTSVEVGWIEPRPESVNRQSLSRPISGLIDGQGAINVPRGVTNQKRESSVAVTAGAQEPSQLQSQPPASSTTSVPPPS